MFTKKRQVRLPKVRRRAGESVSEEREKRVYDKLPVIVFAPVTFWCLFLVTQLQESNATLRRPAFWLSFAIIFTILSAIWFMRLFPIARRLNRGERGELHVADVLEELRMDGYKPVHDIVGNGFNIDHVIVGPGGVFAIETKYRSGKGQITFRNGETLLVGGFPEEKNCLKQARGSAKAVSHLIAENCARREWVTPIVVFVGDWKIRNEWRDTDARVFTPDGLSRYIRNQQPRLTCKEIELIASHLERSVKS
jgi:Nuclease-related domain.